VQTIHHYSSTHGSLERLVVLITLAFLSSGLTIGLTVLLPQLFATAVWQAIITAMILYVFFIYVFNQHLWKWRLWRALGRIRTPSLQGTWKGKLTSSWGDHSQLFEVEIIIQQTWLWVAVNLYANEATSTSITASVLRRDTGEVSVCYIYEAIPKDGIQPAVIERHNGMCILTLHNHNTLSGFYEYFDRTQQQGVLGQIYVER